MYSTVAYFLTCESTDAPLFFGYILFLGHFNNLELIVRLTPTTLSCIEFCENPAKENINIKTSKVFLITIIGYLLI